MRRGLSIDEDAPPHLAGFEAVEFRLHPGNMGERRADIARQLRDRFQYVSAHLPSFLPAVYATGGQWSAADRAFSEFLEMKIQAAHLHTVAYPGGPDHSLAGLDIGPWVKRLVQRHPDVVLVVEVMGGYSIQGRAAALEAWLA